MTLDDRLQTFAEYQPNRRGESLATETNEFYGLVLIPNLGGV